MNTSAIESFYVIGIEVRTTNEDGQSAKDIPLLWNKFFTENIGIQIPNKVEETLYCIYTDYELDHTKPYTTILGCKVSDLSVVPEGFRGLEIEGGNYGEFVAKGKMSDNIVFEEWLKIWTSDLPRTYKADFESYGAKAQNPDDAEIGIYLSI